MKYNRYLDPVKKLDPLKLGTFTLETKKGRKFVWDGKNMYEVKTYTKKDSKVA